VDKRRRSVADGALAEQIVADRLVDAGWEVVARNWTGAGGELDVVVARLGQLRFVEVKARRPEDPGGLDAVGRMKRRRLVRAARAFLAAWEDVFDEACFMVAMVWLPASGAGLDLVDAKDVVVDWLDDAFDA